MVLLIAFLSGILFSELIRPIYQYLIELFFSYIESKKSKYAVTITECNAVIENIKEGCDMQPTRVLGFAAPDDYYDDEDDGCFDKHSKK